jgi:predicted DsbA family dithiol-disulfide isomerase
MQSTQAKPPDLVIPRVLVFFDYACQFCYLDWPRFKRLRVEHEVELFLAPYELRPGLPAEGVPIDQIGGHSAKVEEHMRRMAREGDLGLTFPRFVPNTHLALALGEYARDLGPEAHEAVHEAIFEAYNARSEDIGDEEVLLRVAEARALDTDDVRLAFEEGRYDERIHQFLHLAMAMGVSATPSALICNELFIGSRPYRVLEESLERCLVTPDKIEVGAEAGEHLSRPVREGRAGSREGDPPSIER